LNAGRKKSKYRAAPSRCCRWQARLRPENFKIRPTTCRLHASPSSALLLGAVSDSATPLRRRSSRAVGLTSRRQPAGVFRFDASPPPLAVEYPGCSRNGLAGSGSAVSRIGCVQGQWVYVSCTVPGSSSTTSRRISPPVTHPFALRTPALKALTSLMRCKTKRHPAHENLAYGHGWTQSSRDRVTPNVCSRHSQ